MEQIDSRLAGSQLSGALTSLSTSLSLVTVAPGLSAGRYRFRIDAEQLSGVYSGSGTSFTSLSRGLAGTTAASHRDGVQVHHVLADNVTNLLTVEELDGTPSLEGVRKIVLPNGTLGVSGTTATYTPTGGGGGGSGTVTSVDMTVPSDLAVSGNPITGAGTLAVTRTTQTQNKVLASPDGSTGTPVYRALVAADIPAIAESGVTNLGSDLGLKAPIASPTFTGITTAPEFSASGLTGATAASRNVGATTSGAPVSGTFVLGDWIIDQTGKRWTCTIGGSPGTWVQEPGTGGGGGGLYSAFLCYQDQKASSTVSGTFTSGAWRTRDINTEVADTGNNGSVGSNQITLAAGTYDTEIRCPAFACQVHAARLQDITNAVTLLSSGAGYANNYPAQDNVFIVGRFTLSGSTVLEVQHRCSLTVANQGFGVEAGGTFTVAIEVYTSAQFWKV